MRTIDAGYSYDELEGFEDVATKQIKVPQNMIVLSIYSWTIRMTQKTWLALGSPEYIRCKANTDRRLLLIEKSDAFAENTMTVTMSEGQHMVGNRTLARIIEALTKRDLSVVNVHLIGEPCKTIKNAVIFDCANCKVLKKQERKKKNG